MARYSAGPWSLGKHYKPGDPFDLYAQSGEMVFSSGSYENMWPATYDDAEDEANARLIAAAPELLEVAIKSHEPYVGLDEEDIRCLYGADEADLAMALRSAIAKAVATQQGASQ